MDLRDTQITGKYIRVCLGGCFQKILVFESVVKKIHLHQMLVGIIQFVDGPK